MAGDRSGGRRPAAAIVVGLFAGVAGSYALFLALMLLGGATGVVAMCPTGPGWWVSTLLILVIAAPVIGGAGLGVLVGRWYFRRNRVDA